MYNHSVRVAIRVNWCFQTHEKWCPAENTLIIQSKRRGLWAGLVDIHTYMVSYLIMNGSKNKYLYKKYKFLLLEN